MPMPEASAGWSIRDHCEWDQEGEMTMQCRELRDVADSYLAEELLVETNHEVLRHLDGCPACREEVSARRQLRATLKQAFVTAESLQPDAEWVGRLSAGLRTRALSRPARRFRPAQWWLLAAGLALAAVVGRAAWHRQGDDRRVADAFAHDAAGDHRDCALHFRLAQAPIPLEEAAQEYDAAFHLLDVAVRSARDAQGHPFELVESHACIFAGRRFAHIVLRSRGQLVSVLVAARDGTSASASPPGPGSAPTVMSLSPIEGFQTAAFAASRHEVFVVSELAEADNLAIARAVASPVYHHLVTA